MNYDDKSKENKSPFLAIKDCISASTDTALLVLIILCDKSTNTLQISIKNLAQKSNQEILSKLWISGSKERKSSCGNTAPGFHGYNRLQHKLKISQRYSHSTSIHVGY